MNDIVNDRALTHLGPAETRLASILGRPKPIAIACVVMLAALGWGACALIPAGGDAYLFCRPAIGRGTSAIDAVVSFAMWAAMTLAMMLPTAGPMILTYAEIADTAARKGEGVVSPMVLTGGYISIWLAFAAVMAVLQVSSAPLAEAWVLRTPVTATIFLIAGLYQFSALKQACLAICQRPFPFFFTNWTTRTRGVFVLGLRQGLFCLGCCWALMLVMFAVGTMNVLWMAALGIVMTIEKMSTSTKFSRAIGGACIAIAFATIVMELK